MTIATEIVHPGQAFDRIADKYDSVFTDTMIGRLQRHAVWRSAERVFRAGDRVLELNCGTGEDALFLARKGIAVCACDASESMIERSRARMKANSPPTPAEFRVLATEDLRSLPRELLFDGAFSNFAGLNCVPDLSQTASDLARLLRPGAHILLCFAARFCAWEIAHYSLRGNFEKAFRRTGGSARARVGGSLIHVYYPTVKQILCAFRTKFVLRSITGVGLAVPPSSLEPWAQRHPTLMQASYVLDRVLCRVPGLRVLADHMLIHLERAW